MTQSISIYPDGISQIELHLLPSLSSHIIISRYKLKLLCWSHLFIKNQFLLVRLFLFLSMTNRNYDQTIVLQKLHSFNCVASIKFKTTFINSHSLKSTLLDARYEFNCDIVVIRTTHQLLVPELQDDCIN